MMTFLLYLLRPQLLEDGLQTRELKLDRKAKRYDYVIHVVIGEWTRIYRVGIEKFQQVCIEDELIMQMIVVGMHGQYLKFVTIYESNEWSEWNPKGVVRLSREVASEIL